MEYTAIRDCYYSDGQHKHRFFKAGQKLPEGWLHDANECTHFRPTMEAKQIIKTGAAEQKALTAGDDPRGTKELRSALRKFMNSPVPQTWSRKKVWSKLRERENAVARDAVTNPSKEKK